MSTPHINVTGFIDDTYHDNRGTRLEEGIRTRANKGSNSINAKLRDDFTRLKVTVYEWGETVCSRAHSIDVIDKKYSLLCTQIELKISEVLLKRGDYGLVGELGRLKDKLNPVRKEAKQLTRAPLHENRIPPSDKRTGECSIRDLSGRSYNTEDVFLDEQPLGDISRGGGEMNLSRIDLMSNNFNLDEQPSGDISRGRDEINLSRINLMSDNVNAPSVVACGQGTMSGPSLLD